MLIMALCQAITIRVCLDWVINDDCLAALVVGRFGAFDLAEFANWVVPRLARALGAQRPAVLSVAVVPHAVGMGSQVVLAPAVHVARW